MIRSALPLLVASSMLAVAATVATVAAAAPGRAYVSNCGTLEQHPAAIVLTCADANYSLAGLEWRGWASASSAATGETRANDCTPNCAAGHFHTYRVKVVADHLDSCKGRRVYLRLTLSYPGERPTGHKNPEQWTFTCAQAIRG